MNPNKRLSLAAISIAIALTLSYAAHPKGAYVEENGGFLIVPPDKWIAFEHPEMKYKVLVDTIGQANINFYIYQVGESNIPDDIFQALVEQDPHLKIISKEDFKTAKGVKGRKAIGITENEGDKFRLLFYVIPKDKGSNLIITNDEYMVATCLSQSSSDGKFDAAFDKAMKTFEWIKK